MNTLDAVLWYGGIDVSLSAASGDLGHVRRELSYGGDTNVSRGDGPAVTSQGRLTSEQPAEARNPANYMSITPSLKGCTASQAANALLSIAYSNILLGIANDDSSIN